ncbi:MAG: amidohydrolase family protein [Anaerolineales bacterium]
MLVINATFLEIEGERVRLSRDGALRLDEGRIMDIGDSLNLCQGYPEEKRLDARGMLVMPGMICPYTLLHEPLWKGASRSSSLFFPPLRPSDTGGDYEDLRYHTLLGCIRAIRNGTTTVFDYHFSPHLISHALDAMAEAIYQAGIRGCVSHVAREDEGATVVQEGIKENVRFARRVAGEPLLVASMGLETSGGFSDDMLGAIIRAGALSDMGFSVIISKTSADDRRSGARYGMGVLDRLKRFGILAPRTLLLGCEDMTSYEMDTVLQARTWPVYNPVLAALHASEALPVARLLESGLKVCIGCGRHLSSMFGALQSAYFLHRHAWGAARKLGIEEIGRMIFQNNAGMASIVFRDRLGYLEEGGVADLIFLDRPRVEVLDEKSLFEDLAVLVGEIHVDTTIVAGRVLMRHGEILTLNEEAIAERARERGFILPILQRCDEE